MSKIALTILVFGLYLAALGLVLLVDSNILLRLFTLPTTTEVCIRVVGILVLFLALSTSRLPEKR